MSEKGHLCGGHVWHAVDLTEMAEVRRKDVNLYSYDRQVSETLGRAIDVMHARPFELEHSPLHAGFREAVAGATGLPEDAVSLLCDDIRSLAVALAEAAPGGTPVIVRLEQEGGQTCPKWHTDNLALRLITTYRGPGTQWLRPSGQGAERERQAARFAVLVMKGDRYPGNRGRGLTHRSPPNDDDSPRLVLRMDVSRC